MPYVLKNDNQRDTEGPGMACSCLLLALSVPPEVIPGQEYMNRHWRNTKNSFQYYFFPAYNNFGENHLERMSGRLTKRVTCLPHNS